MLKRRHIAPTVLLTTILVAGILTTCSKNPKCWGDDKNKGIINSSIQIDCSPTIFSNFEENYIITTDSAYQKAFLDTTTGQPKCSLPTIDFSTYSLLGQRASGQCNLKFIREVTRLDSETKYHYKVTVKSCGACKSLGYSDNWVTVPKLPTGWTVTFEVKEK